MQSFFALLSFGWVLCAQGSQLHTLTARSNQMLQDAVRGISKASEQAKLSKYGEVSQTSSSTSNVIPRSSHPAQEGLELLSEYGYHWCPEWSGAGWCPEGYLCGDNLNGCAWNTCCSDDPNIISCPSSAPNSGISYTPCGRNNVPDDGDQFDYMCCHVEEICGDGAECTNHCPKGQCCPFIQSDAPEYCYPDADEEFVINDEDCPPDITIDCCHSHWEFGQTNEAVEMAWADFLVCNSPCYDFDNLDANWDDRTLTTHCNYCLGMFEYVCHREQGAICSIEFSWDMPLEVYAEDEDGNVYDYSGTYSITQIDYECLANECDSTTNEEAILQYRLNEVNLGINETIYQNLQHSFTCSQIPHIGSIKEVEFDAEEDCPIICPQEPCVCPDGGDQCNCPTEAPCPQCTVCEQCQDCERCQDCEQCQECEICDDESSTADEDECPQIPQAVTYDDGDFKTEEKVIGTIVIQRSMAEFGYDKSTIANKLIEDFEIALKIYQRINILSIVEGSIIATFEILPVEEGSSSGSANVVYQEIQTRVQDNSWQDSNELSLLKDAKDVGCVSACDPDTQSNFDTTRLAVIIVIPVVIVMLLLSIVVYCCLRKQVPRSEPRPSLLDDQDDNRGRQQNVQMGETIAEKDYD